MKFQDLLNTIFQETSENNEDDEFKNEIATCVLFLELAYADFTLTDDEEKNIESNLKKFFNLSQNEVEELIAIARNKRNQRNDIWIFTNQIKEYYSRPRKIKIIELLWQLVYADGKMDKYEEVLMRRISNLLGLTHSEMIEAKLKAKT